MILKRTLGGEERARRHAGTGAEFMRHVSLIAVAAGALLFDKAMPQQSRPRLNLTEIGMTAVLAIGFTILVATWGTRTARAVVSRIE
jgi:hypothetical protein